MRVGVNIHFGHFGGLSNKNMTKRQRECGIRLFFFFLQWDTTGLSFLFDESMGLPEPF